MSYRLEPVLEAGAHATPPGAIATAEERAMLAAIRLARRGIGTTHPNPRVGAIVLRGDTIVGSGYHARAGDAHAESRALDEAGERAAGATLVVTLEPCAHFGRTPPCADRVIGAGIRRVVVGMVDPNPLVDGRGLARLREAGLEVAVGVRADECRALNPPYLKRLATGLPWVTLKAMTSLDGRIASESGASRGLGGEAELRLAHRIRAEHDAVLVGIGTVKQDDPLLTVRHARGRSPWRIVLDSRLRLGEDARLLASAGESPVIVATVSGDARRIAALEARGARVWSFPPGADGRVPLEPLLRKLVSEGRYALLVEGGRQVHTAFLREGFADRVAIGIAPLLLGGANAPAWTGDLGRGRVEDAIPIGRLSVRRVGRDVWLEGEIHRDGSPGEERSADV
jgi:diaminohydroxyphosphoribosylaminopyrimidine deaminase/5-amino-6-(5-phosphoribosylamino)uracil reductase